MSIMDILNSGALNSILQQLGGQAGMGGQMGYGQQAYSQQGYGQQGGLGQLAQVLMGGAGQPMGQEGGLMSSLGNSMGGNMGGMLGAAAIGALLGNVLPEDTVKSAAVLGAGVVAWNFYQKWAANRQQEAQEAQQMKLDDTSTLALRAMMFAARADGNIDATERQRIQALMSNMMPGQNVDQLMASFEKEMLDPKVLAQQIKSKEQGEDLYRLSSMVIDVDHFMERGYLDTLAQSLGIDQAKKMGLEKEAVQAKAQLQQAMTA